MHKPAGIELNLQFVENAFLNNPDGFGMIRKNNNGIQTAKGAWDLSNIMEHATPIAKNEEALLHFRLATHGSVKDSNCHPFEVGPGAYLMHNGVLPYESIKDRTDTEAFVIAKRAELKTGQTKKIKKSLGKNVSRLAIVYSNMDTVKVGERVNIDGIHLSNAYSHLAPYSGGFWADYYPDSINYGSMYNNGEVERVNGEPYILMYDGKYMSPYYETITAEELEALQRLEYPGYYI